MKVVIDIPEWKYKSICEGVEASKSCGVVGVDPDIHEAIYNGALLEDIIAEIADMPAFEYETYRFRTRALDILDNIGEADFPQAKDVEPTVENFSKVLDNKLIKDAIRDCEIDIKGSRCCTCKNSDDEFSGECYECIKGIFDHYEPEDATSEESEIHCSCTDDEMSKSFIDDVSKGLEEFTKMMFRQGSSKAESEAGEI